LETQHNESGLSILEVLLILQILVGGNHDLKPSLFHCLEQLTVFQPLPALV
jgi:hypothetical protein